MSSEVLIFIIIAVVGFLFLLTLLKSLLKAAIFIVIFIVLFRVGWVYSSEDLKEKLHLDEFISEEYKEKFFNKYDEYKEKRSEDEVIDTDKINETINNHLKILDDKVDEYIEEKRNEEN
jgi:uncharacterized protein YacL